MIDTIALTLKFDMFKVTEPHKFQPSADNIIQARYVPGGRGYMKCTQNHTPIELKSGIYKPRLTLTRRPVRDGKFEITLRIEFSIPKLLFGNNFDELEDEDFYDVLVILQKKLKEMGVEVEETVLATASVSTIHIGKNIILTDFSTPYSYIKDLTKLNINQSLDTNQTDYRNEGHSWKYRANTFEVAIYDKKRDLEYAGKSRKRAEEKDNELQLNLFNNRPKAQPFEVLRLEVRLNTKQKVRQILRKTGRKGSPTFYSLFGKSVARDILLYFIDEIEEAYPPILLDTNDTNSTFLSNLITSYPNIKPSNALKIAGLRAVIQEIGVREFRQIMSRFGKTTWYPLNKLMKDYSSHRNKKSIFTLLREQINDFKSVKLVDYQSEMLNNDKYEK